MAQPVSDVVHDIEQYTPRSGRVIGEDGEIYNLVDLLQNGGGGGTTDHAALSNLDIASSGHAGFASQVGLDNEVSAREQAISDKQGQIEQLNSALTEGLEALSSELQATNADLQTMDRSYWGDPTAPTKAEQDGFKKTTDNRLGALEESGGASDHSELKNLDFTSSGHTGFASDAVLQQETTNRQQAISGLTTEISGMQTDLDTIDKTLHGNPSASTKAEEDGFIETTGNRLTALEQGGGTTNHAALQNLDFASSGHTDFASASALQQEVSDRQQAINGLTTELNGIQADLDTIDKTLNGDPDVPSQGFITTTDNRLTALEQGGGGVVAAIDVSFDSTNTKLISDNVQNALEEVSGKFDRVVTSQILTQRFVVADSNIFTLDNFPKDIITVFMGNNDEFAIVFDYTVDGYDVTINTALNIGDTVRIQYLQAEEGIVTVNNAILDNKLDISRSDRAFVVESGVKENLGYQTDGYLLRFEIPGTVNIPANTGNVVLTQGLTIAHLARYSNTNPGDWNITANGEIQFKPYDRYQRVAFEWRLTGTIAGAGPGGTGELLAVHMERMVGGVMTTASSSGIMNVGTLANKRIYFDSYTDNALDPFITNGVRWRMTNESPGAITITNRVLLIQGQKF